MMSWSQLYQEHLATIEAQASKIAELEAAVRNIPEYILVGVDENENDYYLCGSCGVEKHRSFQHHDDCPWVKANTLVGE